MHENEKVNNVKVNQCQRAPHQGHHRVSNNVIEIPQMSIVCEILINFHWKHASWQLVITILKYVEKNS